MRSILSSFAKLATLFRRTASLAGLVYISRATLHCIDKEDVSIDNSLERCPAVCIYPNIFHKCNCLRASILDVKPHTVGDVFQKIVICLIEVSCSAIAILHAV